MASGYPDWLRAFALLGKYLEEYKVVAVDVDGNLYALLQGMTPDDELRTVRLDDEGRISAFVIDSTDAWARMLSIGNAELAVRLGSPVAYDRRGQVFLAEDFETGWDRWTPHIQGSKAAIALDPTTSATGGYSVKCTAGTTLGKYSYLLFRRGVLPVGRVGIEFSFAVPGTVERVYISVLLDNGVHYYEAKFWWVQVGNDLQINDADVGMTSVGTAKLADAHKRRFNTLKGVVDLTTEKYVRLLFNQQEIDISDHAIYPFDPGARPRITVEAGMYGTGGTDEIAYIDDIILTFAEPE